MSTAVRAITVIDESVYELLLVAGVTFRRIRCAVTEHGGIRAVQPTPDVFMTGELPARIVSAAVLAFHDAVHADWKAPDVPAD